VLARIDALKHPVGMAAAHGLPDLGAITDLSADFLCDTLLISDGAAAGTVGIRTFHRFFGAVAFSPWTAVELIRMWISV
jgi:hypothetical protein